MNTRTILDGTRTVSTETVPDRLHSRHGNHSASRPCESAIFSPVKAYDGRHLDQSPRKLQSKSVSTAHASLQQHWFSSSLFSVYSEYGLTHQPSLQLFSLLDQVARTINVLLRGVITGAKHSAQEDFHELANWKKTFCDVCLADGIVTKLSYGL